MREYIYKILIFTLAIIVIFEFTIGKEISQVSEKMNQYTTAEGRKEVIASLKEEIEKANKKENYLDEEERLLIRDFIIKIKKELELN